MPHSQQPVTRRVPRCRALPRSERWSGWRGRGRAWDATRPATQRDQPPAVRGEVRRPPCAAAAPAAAGRRPARPSAPAELLGRRPWQSAGQARRPAVHDVGRREQQRREESRSCRGGTLRSRRPGQRWQKISPAENTCRFAAMLATSQKSSSGVSGRRNTVSSSRTSSSPCRSTTGVGSLDSTTAPSGAQDAAPFGEGAGDIGQVVQHPASGDHIDAGAGQRQARAVRLHERPGASRPRHGPGRASPPTGRRLRR